MKEFLLNASIASSSAFLMAGFYFGASRSFESFLLALVFIPALLLISTICLFVAVCVDRKDQRVKLAAIFLVLAPIAAYASNRLQDHIEFFFWSINHRAALREALTNSEIISRWDTWGMAGNENDSYLISDTSDGSSTEEGAEHWRKKMGLKCPIAGVEQMERGIYIVITYNCPFNGVALPDS